MASRQTLSRVFLTALILSSAAGCSARYLKSPSMLVAEAPLKPNGFTSHVILVSVDGLRPDAIAQYDATTMSRLIREGSYTLAATTITPSKTLPSHTSMLTGESPDKHGVLWNSNQTMARGKMTTPTVFSVLRSKGYRTAAFFSKSKFQHLQQAGSLDFSQAPGGWFGRWSADRTVADVERYLASERPNLLFVHLADVDAAGHSAGWMTPRYGEAVRLADASIARMAAAAEKAFGSGNYTLIVTADHGGHNKDHGSADPRDVNIPWIVWGRGVEAGVLSARVRTMDTAATVLWLFNVPEPTDWAGSPVTGAFQNRALVN